MEVDMLKNAPILGKTEKVEAVVKTTEQATLDIRLSLLETSDMKGPMVGEAKANLMLALRHLEDARFRIISALSILKS